MSYHCSCGAAPRSSSRDSRFDAAVAARAVTPLTSYRGQELRGAGSRPGVGLAGISMAGVCRRIRASRDVPIIVTASGDELDHVLAAGDRCRLLRGEAVRVPRARRSDSSGATTRRPAASRRAGCPAFGRLEVDSVLDRSAWTATRSNSPRRSSICWHSWPTHPAPFATVKRSSRGRGTSIGGGPKVPMASQHTRSALTHWDVSKRRLTHSGPGRADRAPRHDGEPDRAWFTWWPCGCGGPVRR
jgi:hypothetical protein